MVMTRTSHFFAWLSIGHIICILFNNKIVHNPCGTGHKVFDNLLSLNVFFHCMITLKEVSHLNLILKKFLLFIIMRSIHTKDHLC